jgi:nitrite reductase/ring-hydroxylating ferredoxin subunit
MTSIRVADVAELPPGKGKVVEIADREVRVFNVDGRFFATATRQGRMAHGPGETGPANTTHPRHGTTFDVYVEDSPARVRADQEHFAVRIEDETVWLELPDQ